MEIPCFSQGEWDDVFKKYAEILQDELRSIINMLYPIYQETKNKDNVNPVKSIHLSLLRSGFLIENSPIGRVDFLDGRGWNDATTCHAYWDMHYIQQALFSQIREPSRYTIEQNQHPRHAYSNRRLGEFDAVQTSLCTLIKQCSKNQWYPGFGAVDLVIGEYMNSGHHIAYWGTKS